MSASDAEAWARLRLVQGRSSAELWELVHALGHSMLTVGSGAGCSWIVEESGVAPVHFSLHWDGSALRIADTHGVGNLRVDGEPVSSEWRLISGRARIDFGQAAIVVETSAGSVSDLGHPLDHAPLPPLSADGRHASSHPPLHGEVAPRVSKGGSPKATLLGVAPLTPRGAPIIASVPSRPTTPIESAGPAAREDSESFRLKRPSDNVRAPKPTLLGIAAQALPASPPAPATPAPTASSGSVTRPMGQTLHGTGPGTGGYNPVSPSQRVSGASLTEGDQRTMQGFPTAAAGSPAGVTLSSGGSTSSVPPGRRETQRGVISVPPGVVHGAVMQMRVKPISDQAPPPSTPYVPGEGHASPAEVMDPGFAYHGDAREVPQAVLLGAPPAGHPGSHAHLPDAAAEMRDVAPFESQRPRRPFPWHYVGLAVLTVLAYGAWLYLLDHL